MPSYQGQNNSLRSNETNHSVVRHNIDLNVPYVENDSYTDQNPFEPVAPDNHSEQGVGNNMMNMSCNLSSNRSPEHASREFSLGEGSRSAVHQARMPTSHDAIVQTYDSLNIVPAASNGAANIYLQQFGSEFGHQPIMPVRPNMQQMNGARHHHPLNDSLFSFEARSNHGLPSYDVRTFRHATQIGAFQNHNHNIIDANPVAFAPPGNLSMGHVSNFHGLSPRQTPLYPLYHHPYLSGQGSIGSIPYGQPFVHFPIFHHTLTPSPWVSLMGPVRAFPPFPPVYTVPPRGVNPNNIPRNIMFSPETTGAQSPYYVANLNFDNGSANFLGNVAPPPSHYGPFLNAPIGFPRLNNNAFEYYMPMSFGVVNHRAAAPIGFQWPSSSFNQLDSVDNTWFQNQVRVPQQISEDLASLYVNAPTFTEEARNRMLNEVLNVIQELREARSRARQTELQPITGLSEEDIMSYLKLEEFQLPTGGTPEDVDCCCICQDEYANGDYIGVLDCGHKFHYNCVKKWLGIKNTCPMCVGIGLAV